MNVEMILYLLAQEVVYKRRRLFPLCEMTTVLLEMAADWFVLAGIKYVKVYCYFEAVEDTINKKI
jgi:hypothetical protein